MRELEFANEQMSVIKNLIYQKPSVKFVGTLSVGIDLGTASIVLVVVDQEGTPVFSAFEEANVIRDGLIVNYSETVQIVKRLKRAAEEALATELVSASGAVPPGTTGNNRQVVGHVIESAEMIIEKIIEEPEAAALALNVKEGAVVDIGGGTTGISIFEKGKMVFSADEPTGGTQMSLVIAGALNIPLSEGEKVKRDSNREKENFFVVRPVIEKMATITERFIQDYGKPIEKVYLVGGATKFKQFTNVFENKLEATILQPDFPEFVTPLGIALANRKDSLK